MRKCKHQWQKIYEMWKKISRNKANVNINVNDNVISIMSMKINQWIIL